MPYSMRVSTGPGAQCYGDAGRCYAAILSPYSQVRCLVLPPDLRQATLLGSYADRDEYQIGRMLVWVEFGSPSRKQAATELACEQFSSVWAAIPSAVARALQHSQGQLPEFWEAHEAAGSSEEVLCVWGIWMQPFSGTATYHVSTNHEFFWGRGKDLPEFPEEGAVMICRSPEGDLQVETTRAADEPGT